MKQFKRMTSKQERKAHKQARDQRKQKHYQWQLLADS